MRGEAERAGKQSNANPLHLCLVRGRPRSELLSKRHTTIEVRLVQCAKVKRNQSLLPVLPIPSANIIPLSIEKTRAIKKEPTSDEK